MHAFALAACLHCSKSPHALTRRAEAQAEFFDIKTLSLGVALIQNKAVITKYKPIHLVDLVRLSVGICSALLCCVSLIVNALAPVHVRAPRPTHLLRALKGPS